MNEKAKKHYEAMQRNLAANNHKGVSDELLLAIQADQNSALLNFECGELSYMAKSWTSAYN